MALNKTSVRSLRAACEVCGDTTKAWFATDTVTGEQNIRVHERNGMLVKHACDNEDRPTVVDSSVVEPAPVAPVAPSTPAPATDSRMAAIESLLGLLTAAPAIDRDQVEAIAREVAEDVTRGIVAPTKVVYQPANADEATRTVEGAHPKLDTLARLLMIEQDVYLYGPAGTGKSTLAVQAAELLGVEFGALSFGPQTPQSLLVGFMSASGAYVTTTFRDRYEHGGVFLADEMDSCNPAVLVTLNGALANGFCAFPDGMVKRHPDFRFVGAGNTNLMGANRQYNARAKMDAAVSDRFTFVKVELDETVEHAMCTAVADSDTVTRVIEFVAKVRVNIASTGSDMVVSPRASKAMCEMLSAGFSWDEAIDMRVRKGADDTVWAKVSA
ncbi:AAA-ATPase [Gordonia Phage Sephiroth]|uniref:AAA-ATPase n=1 Tax=Gordonia Phage Sephiroth TaxID=2767553 RepID=A0A7G9UZL4_9CAUD|nr:porphyrin biosynthesis [Gordonia Phage Sephiroth]QNN99469.1 AAA-ATPase [Gordonia Phage Sephiroth]